jgi:hypothetical protein
MGQTVTVVALTGWGQDEDRERSRDAGFDHHLTNLSITMRWLRLLAAPATAGHASASDQKCADLV